MVLIENITSEASITLLRQMVYSSELRIFSRLALLSLNRSQRIEIPYNELIIQHQHQTTQAVKLTRIWFDSGSRGDVYQLTLENDNKFVPDFGLCPDIRVLMRCQIKPTQIHLFGREYSSVVNERDIRFLSNRNVFENHELSKDQPLRISYESIIRFEQDANNFLTIICQFSGLEIGYNNFGFESFLLHHWDDERNERWYTRMRVIE